jgi:hypothetical protein
MIEVLNVWMFLPVYSRPEKKFLFTVLTYVFDGLICFTCLYIIAQFSHCCITVKQTLYDAQLPFRLQFNLRPLWIEPDLNHGQLHRYPCLPVPFPKHVMTNNDFSKCTNLLHHVDCHNLFLKVIDLAVCLFQLKKHGELTQYTLNY